MEKEFRSVSSQNLGLEAPKENEADEDTDTSEADDEQFALYTELLYNQARLIAGLPLDDVVAFTKNISKLM
jgi:molecular chaperone HtpG